MRILQRVRDAQNMSLNKDGNYNVTYEYDDRNRIVAEKVTGDINREKTFEYDDEDNVTKEIYKDGIKIVTKVFEYEQVTGNIIGIQVTTTDQ